MYIACFKSSQAVRKPCPKSYQQPLVFTLWWQNGCRLLRSSLQCRSILQNTQRFYGLHKLTLEESTSSLSFEMMPNDAPNSWPSSLLGFATQPMFCCVCVLHTHPSCCVDLEQCFRYSEAWLIWVLFHWGVMALLGSCAEGQRFIFSSSAHLLG